MSGKSPSRSEQYRQSLVRNLAAELANDSQLCPKCGDGWIQAGTAAGKMGVCPACWNRALAEAQRLASKEIDARREYDRERRRRCNEKRRGAT